MSSKRAVSATALQRSGASVARWLTPLGKEDLVLRGGPGTFTTVSYHTCVPCVLIREVRYTVEPPTRRLHMHALRSLPQYPTYTVARLLYQPRLRTGTLASLMPASWGGSL